MDDLCLFKDILEFRYEVVYLLVILLMHFRMTSLAQADQVFWVLGLYASVLICKMMNLEILKPTATTAFLISSPFNFAGHIVLIGRF